MGAQALNSRKRRLPARTDAKTATSVDYKEGDGEDKGDTMLSPDAIAQVRNTPSWPRSWANFSPL
jgi:hypothetical protein